MDVRQALHGFTATNEDELTFGTGDLIEILKELDGGWWEGRHVEHGSTGWFPCNHVAPRQRRAQPPLHSAQSPSPSKPHPVMTAQLSPSASDADQEKGLQQFFNSENRHVAALAENNRTFLLPLADVDWLDDDEKALLLEPFGMVLSVHQKFVRSFAQELSKMKDAKLSACFLDFAQDLAMIDCGYAAVHESIESLMNGRCKDTEDPLFVHLQTDEQVQAFHSALSAPIERLLKYSRECRKLNIVNLTTGDSVGLEPGQFEDVMAAFQSIHQAVQRIRAQKSAEVMLKRSQIGKWHGPSFESMGAIDLITSQALAMDKGSDAFEGSSRPVLVLETETEQAPSKAREATVVLFTEYLVVLANVTSGPVTSRSSANMMDYVLLHTFARDAIVVDLVASAEDASTAIVITASSVDSPKSLEIQFDSMETAQLWLIELRVPFHWMATNTSGTPIFAVNSTQGTLAGHAASKALNNSPAQSRKLTPKLQKLSPKPLKKWAFGRRFSFGSAKKVHTSGPASAAVMRADFTGKHAEEAFDPGSLPECDEFTVVSQYSARV